MANEKRLKISNRKCADCIHVNACARVSAVLNFPFETIALYSIECKAYEPTVDAVEVVHGEWEIIEDDYFDLVELKCSACGESYGFEDYEDDTPKNYHYCPNCGAKMDGDGNV